MRLPSLLALGLLAVACAPRPAPLAPAPAASTTAPPPAPPGDEERELLEAQTKLATTLAVGLRVGAAIWKETRGTCPTADDIVKAGLVSPALRSRDVWGTPYRITCPTHGAPVVSSAGPDLTFGTGDDITVGDEPGA